MRVLIAGCGYLGTALARELLSRGHGVTALSRTRPVGLPEACDWHSVDLRAKGGWQDQLAEPDAIVFAASPDEFSEAGYRHAFIDAQQSLLNYAPAVRYVMVSSLAVYGFNDGREVDEGTPVSPARFNGEVLCEAERRVSSHRQDSVIVRFGGLYGPGRLSRLAKLEQPEIECDPKQFGNRIHRDDAAGLIAHLLELEQAERVYVGVDDDPCDDCEYYAGLAAALHRDCPPLREVVGNSKRGNKRAMNRALHRSGYRLRYPSYRQGVPASLQEEHDT